MEKKYEEIFQFLSVGDYPSGYNKSQRQCFRNSTAKYTIKEGKLFAGGKTVLKCKEEARRIFDEVHSAPIGGHSGIKKTRLAISSQFFWHGMTKDIENWIQECAKCQVVGKRPLAPQPLECFKVSAAWELVGIDLTGPIPETVDGFQYILTATDYFSKWVEAFPLKTKTAAEVGRHLCSLIYRHGCPKRILSDQGGEFVNQLNHQMCSVLGKERSVTAAYHPQTNSLDEKTNDNIRRALSKLVNEKQNNWDVYLEATLFSIRSKVQTTTKFSPFVLMYGREAVFPAEVPFDLPEERGLQASLTPKSSSTELGSANSRETMPAEKKPMRYAHLEGHTDVCFNQTGSCLVTCGSDGDIRIWENIEDDDPKSINVGEKAYSFAIKNGKVVTASSNNAVQMHTFPDGDPDGILTRFTTNANHVVFNSDGTKIAAGSGDFLVKVVQVDDSSVQKTLRGHSAPVLSVAFDPKDEYLASAGCDGTVRIWNIEEQVCEVNLSLLPKCNDIINAKSICRLSWQPKNGKLLAVPVDKTIQFYERDAWMISFTLTDDFITQPLNVVTWSPCGQFIVAGSINGRIVAWNVLNKTCLERVEHEKGFTVCCLSWHPKLAQVAYTDNEGNLGVLENVCQGGAMSASTKVSSAAKKDYDELFDGDDDGDEDFLNGDMIDHEASVGNEDDDDFTPISGHVKKRAILDDDDNSLDVPSLKAKDAEKPGGQEGDQSFKAQAVPYPSKPTYSGPMPTPPQKPFQPGSTPSHLLHRFMMWNSIGVIRCYNDEQDNAIDVEFHDTSIHHAIHLTNTLNHTIADMSQEAVLLACDGTEELASKLQCLHFSSWDNSKEWMVDMPKGEDIQAVCMGQGWVACATNALLVRIFTVGGVQKEIFSLLGPVVCMAGHGEQLLIVYHRGTGFDGDQCLGVQLLELGKRKRQVLHGNPLPLSKKSFLSWLGFSAEGSPCYVDSEGVVRLLNRSLGHTWTPVCNTREHCKGKSDHCWVVGVHENPQQLRCIPCKGSRFPPTLPRPAVAILPFKFPYCQITTEKGQMEEQYWRSQLFTNYLDYLAKNGYECDDNIKTEAEKEQQELLMKMFALSCKLEREFRCMELAELMTQNVMNLAIKYASRSKRLILAQRLSEMALEKAAELSSAQQQVDEEEEEEDFRSRLNAGYSRTATEWGRPSSKPAAHEHEAEMNCEDGDEEMEDVQPETPNLNKKTATNPFGKTITSPEQPTSKSGTIVSSNQGRVNPFKVSASQKSPALAGSSSRILDNMSKLTKKTPAAGNQSSSKSDSPVIKPLAPKAKPKQGQATLFQNTQPKSTAKKIQEKVNPTQQTPNSAPEINEQKKSKTGFQLWLDENRPSILSENPELDESEIIREGMSRFRALTNEDRMLWTEKAKGDDSADPKKRKREEQKNRESQEGPDGETQDQSNTVKKRKPLAQSANNKLSAFAFKKD
ncbi:WD repeat and HMG-box DNA-binding protein 1 isoform X1 [Bufo gargarizans]|uniref:WD repeat and HMG-box DNA-binding protein 1 isoform X1 n=2 Tax=Bufo gargarizans TaxID=30331 RepID=UPI001CF5CB35|nr:WD repeat and HMG-box DNA-binding protein 1 isoform X1 [Bufo gargarizans]